MEKAHEARDLDLSGAARGVWLVKVPKYLSEKWRKANNSCEVGKLRISKPRFPGGKPEVIFSLNDELAIKEAGDAVQVPKDHKFVLTGIASQSLSVLAQTPTAEALLASDNPPYDQVAIEGKVIQRAECRPIEDPNYMNMKRCHLEMTNKPTREVVQLARAVNTYKPTTGHHYNVAQQQKKKEEGKRVRLDKDKVMDMLFAAFEKHQYYNIKDLEKTTKQPITYLKEILLEICVYNKKSPHRNMWELKPEYRHYKEQKT